VLERFPDTGSPMTYLSEDALDKFDLSIPNKDDLIPARINSRKASVMMSTPNSTTAEWNSHVIHKQNYSLSSMIIVLRWSSPKIDKIDSWPMKGFKLISDI
jgi:hypothetical protein